MPAAPIACPMLPPRPTPALFGGEARRANVLIYRELDDCRDCQGSWWSYSVARVFGSEHLIDMPSERDEKPELIRTWATLLLDDGRGVWGWDLLDTAFAHPHWPADRFIAGGVVGTQGLAYVQPTSDEIAHALGKLGIFRDARSRWEWKGRPYSPWMLRRREFWCEVPKQLACDYYDA